MKQGFMRTSTKLIVAGIMLGLAFISYPLAADLHTVARNHTSIGQLNGGDVEWSAMRQVDRSRAWVAPVYVIVTIVLLGLIFRTEIRKLLQMTSRILLVLAALLPLTLAGCKPYNVPQYEEIDTNETAFLLPLEGDTTDQAQFKSHEYLEKHQVAAKRVQIEKRWNSTGRTYLNGDWIPTTRVVKVHRAPVTVQWWADKKNPESEGKAIWVESRDSISFSTGFTVTANIPENQAAIFLYRYQGKDLKGVLDSEIRARIQSITAEVAAKYDLDVLRSKKQELIDAVRKDVIPFAKERGFEITTVGMFGGFEYENQEVQRAIDKTVQDQQKKVSAEAEKDATRIQNETLQLAAKAKADAENLRADGEAKAIKAIADAKAYEIEKAKLDLATYMKLKQLEVELKRLERWNGVLPYYLIGGAAEFGSILQLPVPPAPEKK